MPPPASRNPHNVSPASRISPVEVLSDRLRFPTRDDARGVLQAHRPFSPPATARRPMIIEPICSNHCGSGRAYLSLASRARIISPRMRRIARSTGTRKGGPWSPPRCCRRRVTGGAVQRYSVREPRADGEQPADLTILHERPVVAGTGRSQLRGTITSHPPCATTRTAPCFSWRAIEDRAPWVTRHRPAAGDFASAADNAARRASSMAPRRRAPAPHQRATGAGTAHQPGGKHADFGYSPASASSNCAIVQ